jgi:hypothetical protein
LATTTSLLDGQGKVTEAPTATFFMVRGVPVTPPVTGSILENNPFYLIQLFREVRAAGAGAAH